MNKLIKAELFKLRKRGMTWILLYIMVGIMILINMLLFAISKITLPNGGAQGMAVLQSILNLSSSVPFSLTIISSFGAVMAVILMASSVGNEYNWRTIRIALISSEGRLKLLAAKLISVVTLVVILMLVSLAVGFLMSMFTNVLIRAHSEFQLHNRQLCMGPISAILADTLYNPAIYADGVSIFRAGPFSYAGHRCRCGNSIFGAYYHFSDEFGRRLGSRHSQIPFLGQCGCH